MGRRLFLAVRPPASVSAELAIYTEPRREAALRWANPEHWHLTLVFLGEVSDDRTDHLVENLGPVAAETPPFDVTVGGAGYFPHTDAAKVLWLGIRQGGAELESLARRCRTAASRAGIGVAGGRYQPHLTLARSNRGIAARRWLNVLESFPPLSWRVGEFVLIDSELTRGGPRHRVSERFEVGEPGRA